MYKKVCKLCSAGFVGCGPAAMYCGRCKKSVLIKNREKNRLRVAAERKASGKIKKPGVGKGGNPLKGKLNPSYKHGNYVFETLRSEIKDERRYCERCNSDLIDATHYLWVVHHKDHNHWNHDLANLELLCKRCHQIEHECWKAFTKAQRLDREIVESSGSKCVDS